MTRYFEFIKKCLVLFKLSVKYKYCFNMLIFEHHLHTKNAAMFSCIRSEKITTYN